MSVAVTKESMCSARSVASTNDIDAVELRRRIGDENSTPMILIPGRPVTSTTE